MSSEMASNVDWPDLCFLEEANKLRATTNQGPQTADYQSTASDPNTCYSQDDSEYSEMYVLFRVRDISELGDSILRAFYMVNNNLGLGTGTPQRAHVIGMESDMNEYKALCDAVVVVLRRFEKLYDHMHFYQEPEPQPEGNHFTAEQVEFLNSWNGELQQDTVVTGEPVYGNQQMGLTQMPVCAGDMLVGPGDARLVYHCEGGESSGQAGLEADRL